MVLEDDNGVLGFVRSNTSSVVLPMLLSAKPLKSVSVEVLRLGGWGETAPLPLDDRWAGGTGETCLGGL